MSQNWDETAHLSLFTRQSCTRWIGKMSSCSSKRQYGPKGIGQTKLSSRRDSGKPRLKQCSKHVHESQKWRRKLMKKNGRQSSRESDSLLATVNLKGSDESFLQLKKKLLLQNMSNVVELKVGLHCEECIKKILKAIKKIHDIDTYDVDTELSKVTVTGNVTTEEVVKALHKIGKTSTKWQGEMAEQLKV